MLTEFARSSIVEREAGLFIQEKYPVDQEIVDRIIKEAESWAPNHLPVTHLLNTAIFEATGSGIDFRVPEMLAAVKKMEIDLPDKEKELSFEMYVKILAVGELSAAHRIGLYRSENFAEVKAHTANALRLLDFIEKLEQ